MKKGEGDRKMQNLYYIVLYFIESVIASSNVIGSKGVSAVDPVSRICKTIGGIHLVCKSGCIAWGDTGVRLPLLLGVNNGSPGVHLSDSPLMFGALSLLLSDSLHPVSSTMVLRPYYVASGRPGRIGYWHRNIFVFILFATKVVAVVTNKVGFPNPEQLSRKC